MQPTHIKKTAILIIYLLINSLSLYPGWFFVHQRTKAVRRRTVFNVLMCFHITYLLLIHYRQLQLPDNEAPISPGALAQSTMGLEPPGASGAFFYRWLKPPAMMPTANNSGLQRSYMKAHQHISTLTNYIPVLLRFCNTLHRTDQQHPGLIQFGQKLLAKRSDGIIFPRRAA